MINISEYLESINNQVDSQYILHQDHKENNVSNVSSRRDRITYTQEQINVLENIFATNRYPDWNVRSELAMQLNISESRVLVKFNNLIFLIFFIFFFYDIFKIIIIF